MNRLSTTLLKTARKSYAIVNPDSSVFGRNWKLNSNKEYSNNLIYNKLTADSPCLIGRFGANEIRALLNYWGIQNKSTKRKTSKFIHGQIPPWWWEKSALNQMMRGAGFFPASLKQLEKFCQLMLEILPEIDILGSWLKQEQFFQESLKNANRVVLEDIEPFFATNPWTKALKGKTVLIVHPFQKSIESQYKKRSLLFENDLLPEFNLKTIKAVQTIAGEKSEFNTWFDALESMKTEIEKTTFDIAIIGCGAYGLPLAAHVKKLGKKAIHLAGVTQLLFGIKGKRWEEYVVWPYKNLMNEHWVRPLEEETPSKAENVEGSCYW